MSETADIDPTEIPITKLWVLFAIIFYILGAVVFAVIDSVTQISLMSGITFGISSIVIFIVSVVLGQFTEYSRQRIKRMEYE